MAISSYSELKTGIENYAANTENTSRLDEFIALCENRMWYGHGDKGDPFYSAPLRITGMESTGDLTISAQTAAQPTGFLYARRLYLDISPKQDVDYLAPDRFWQSTEAQLSTTGKPKLFTIESTNFTFAPSPDDTYTGKLLYYAKLTGLSSSNTTNWIITNAPQLYLYGCLLEFYIYTRNDAEIQKYAQLFSGAINSMNNQDRAMKHSGSDISAHPDNTP